MASNADEDIYDYDGAYDSFHKEASENRAKAESGQQNRKSRYIEALLETAKKRQRERETVYERKVAKQQALEDAQHDFAGKEKFITKAYRRKLEERKQWEADEEQRRQQEEANDVTKKTTAGAAMASFYGNFSRNVAMGGTNQNTDRHDTKTEKNNKEEGIHHTSMKDNLPNTGGGQMDFLSGFERSEEQPSDKEAQLNTTKKVSINTRESGEKELTAREKREQKVALARVRYLQRKGVSLQQ